VGISHSSRESPSTARLRLAVSAWPWLAGAADRATRASCALFVVLAIPLLGVFLLRVALSLDLASLPAALLGVALGALAADGITGLVHWACDSWGSPETPWIGPSLIDAFREHHREPGRMLRSHWIEGNREPAISATAALLLLSLPEARDLLEGQPLLAGFLGSFIAYGAAANQLHRWAHAERPPSIIRMLQRAGLILSPRGHRLHHAGDRTRAYCIATGWLNPVLDATGAWRGLEHGISRLTGIAPRRPGAQNATTGADRPATDEREGRIRT